MLKVNGAKNSGFTLLELLIALFIYAILSTILVGALNSVIRAYKGSEQSADRLRSLQRVFLILSRDIEQALMRPIINATGKEELAFIGDAKGFSFTHFGVADPSGIALRSSMQRTSYAYHDRTLWRSVFPVLDQARETQAKTRALFEGVNTISFEYLDKQHKFHGRWPVEDKSGELLPRAVKINLTFPNWGKMSQLYVIAANPKATDQVSQS